ncbi:hypothetical protein N7540_006184 [Penicillium herquei]|nr:hypothetical protein N7540_006184 [Penicillium herquei]
MSEHFVDYIQFGLKSTHGKEKYINPPWTAVESLRWSGFCKLYTTLKENGSHWEAQRPQRMLLPVVSFENVMGTFIRADQFSSRHRCVPDQHICGAYRAHNLQPNLQLSTRAVLCENSRLGNTEHARPFLQVDELEELLPRVKQALMSYAAAKGHENVMKLLIEKGADIETTDSSGRS